MKITNAGRLEGHLVLGLDMMDKLLALHWGAMKYRDVLRHIMLSHHGQYEWGSPDLPQCIEAQVVHLADLASSRLSTVWTVLANCDTEWSEKILPLNRAFCKSETLIN